MDDINIVPGKCESKGFCDFESDFCGFFNEQPDNKTKRIYWLRNQGLSDDAPFTDGPRYDSTTGTPEGRYVYVPLRPQYGGSAILKSQSLSFVSFSDQIGFCLQFAYNIYAQDDRLLPKLTIQLVNPSSKSPKNISTISFYTNMVWFQYNTTFAAERNFRIWFVTEQGKSSRSYIAIDDIQIYKGKCIDGGYPTTDGPLPPTTPIPQTEKQWDCNFDDPKQPSCSWNIRNNWIVKSYVPPSNDKNQLIGPEVDHTTKNSNGKYLQLNSTDNHINQNFNATITSDVITSTQTHCFSFWFYSNFLQAQSYNLTVGYYNTFDPGNVDTLILIKNVFNEKWEQNSVTIPPNTEPFRIVIQLKWNKITSYSNNFNDLALDDFKLTLGTCSVRMGQVCNFGYGLCNWKFYDIKYHQDRVIGTLTNTKFNSISNLNGPSYDHSTLTSKGEFIHFVNKKDDQVGQYITALNMGEITKTGMIGSCLSFWYQSYEQEYFVQNPTQSLIVTVIAANQQISDMKNVIWESRPSRSRSWMKALINVFATYKHQVNIIAIKNYNQTNQQSYISIDDVSIRDGQCEGPVTCDFDTDFCDWQFQNYAWKRYIQPVKVNTSWNGPLIDHTTGKGSYLYLSPIGQVVSPIISSPIYINKEKCLSLFASFWGSQKSNLTIYVIKNRFNPYNSVEQRIFTRVPDWDLKNQNKYSQNQWKEFHIPIDESIYKNFDQISFKLATTLGDSNSLVAIDDIDLYDGECYTYYGDIAICDDGSTLNKNQICNFDNNCPNEKNRIGADERSCGQCNFEKGIITSYN